MRRRAPDHPMLLDRRDGSSAIYRVDQPGVRSLIGVSNRKKGCEASKRLPEDRRSVSSLEPLGGDAVCANTFWE